MTVNVTKSSFNVREKLKELERPIGVKGNELMRAETVQDARDFISAGRKNLVINGDMRIAQRATSQTNITSSGYYTLDRQQVAFYPQGAVLTESRSTDSPDDFAYSRKIEVTTAGNSATWLLLSYKFEGQDVQSLAKGTTNAKSATLSFWVKANHSGKYAVELHDSDNSRQVSFPYYINTANTWQKIEVTFPPDTTGAFTSDNTESLQISWFLSAGTTFTGGSMTGNWRANSNSNRAVGINQFTNTVGNQFYITGIQLEVGKNATEFEHRSYGEELALCHRYYYRHADGAWDVHHAVASGMWYQTTSTYFVIHFPVEMRTAASLDYSSNGSTTAFVVFNQASSSTTDDITTQEQGRTCYVINIYNLSPARTAGYGAWAQINNNSGAHISFSAEL